MAEPRSRESYRIDMTYRVKGLPNFRAFGAVVEGVDLRKQVSEEVVRFIKRDLLKHRLLIFRGQVSRTPRRRDSGVGGVQGNQRLKKG